MDNILMSMLRLLKVKHTKNSSDKIFREHPHKYNLYGISKMLSDYGVENAGLKIKDKENNIHNLQTPFIAHVSDDFQIVRDVGSDHVITIWKGKYLKTPISEFLNIWSGIVLMVDCDESAIEPDYTVNRRRELFDIVQKAFLSICVLAFILLPFITFGLYSDLWIFFSFILNSIGIVVCFLLVQKQLNVRSEYADKICSLFSQSDCNNVLESDAAKFMGVIGWSEAGLGYFISNVIVLLFFPYLIPFYALINICALPYSFWSVWYQKVKAKQWCPLCLIVQVLFWSLFVINLFAHHIYLPSINIVSIIQFSCIYLIPFLSLNLFIPRLSENQKIEQTRQEINSIKADHDVFLALLRKQPSYHTNMVSKISLGNPIGEIKVTILTNPHCSPCAKMHQRVKKIAAQNAHLDIRYIFSSFEKKLDPSNQFLIASYLNKDKKTVEEIYDEWFEKGKSEAQAFFSIYDFDPLSLPSEAEAEFLKHEKWKELTRLRETPTILVNGYKLPKNYAIEDIRYFTDLNL